MAASKTTNGVWIISGVFTTELWMGQSFDTKLKFNTYAMGYGYYTCNLTKAFNVILESRKILGYLNTMLCNIEESMEIQRRY